jgi:hypothetical protein
MVEAGAASVALSQPSTVSVLSMWSSIRFTSTII